MTISPTFDSITILGNSALGNISSSQCISTGGTTSRTLAARFGEVANVKDFGAAGNGVTDDTAAIQAAANSLTSGGTLWFPSGTYIASTAISIQSNTHVLGEGPGSVLEAAASFTGGILLQNVNRNAPPGSPPFALTDSNLSVSNMTLDFGSKPANAGHHLIDFGFVNIVKIARCIFQVRLSGDAVSLRGCFDTVVDGCSAYDFTNCSYDHWYYPSKGRVVNCYAQTAHSAQMVCWNPDPTTGSSSGYLAQGFVLANCHLVSTDTAATPNQLEPLFAGASVSEMTITGNIFENSSLVMRGDTSNVTVVGNIFKNILGGTEAIKSYPFNGGTPSDITICQNVVSNPATTGGNLGVIRLEGTGTVALNRVVGSTYGSVAGVYIATTGILVFGNHSDNGVLSGPTGGFTLAEPDGTSAGGNGRGQKAVDLQLTRSSATAVASGTSAFAAGANNTVSGGNAAALGTTNTVTGSQAFAAGGFSTVSNQYGHSLGASHTVSGAFSGGFGQGAGDHGRYGSQAFSSKQLSVSGDTQVARQILNAQTTDATPTVATADGAAAGAANIFNIPNNSVYRLSIKVAAKCTGVIAASVWVADNVLLSRDSNAASTTLSTATFTQGGTRGTVTGWSVAAAADTTNGGITVTVTGAVAQTIHWAIEISSVEVQ